MKLIPHGAAREVTGSCHELQIAVDGWEAKEGRTYRMLLDCGLFQGHRAEAAAKNATFAFNPSADIDAVVISHAHMDHVGRVPVLWKKGYRKPIHCTYATKDLAAVMLKDGGYIQEKDEEYFQKHLHKSMIRSDGPLYTQADAEACMALFEGHNYGEWFTIAPGVRVQFLEAGHVLGAAMVLVEYKEGKTVRRMGFTGDLGRSGLPIIRDPARMSDADTLLCESTYGDRLHENISEANEKLQSIIVRTAKRGGKVLIPAFSLERTQQLVYDLHQLWDEQKIPAIPIIIDSPLATAVTDVFQKHPECYDQQMFDTFLSRAHSPFSFSLIKYTASVEESKQLNTVPGPMIIMAGSGMCEAGRIRHHLRNELEDPRNTVLGVGYMAANTLGARLMDPLVPEVKIFDDLYRKKAEIVYIDAYSGHADHSDIERFVGEIEGLKNIILIHGEPLQMDPLAERLRKQTEAEIVTPEKEEEVEVG